MDCSLPLVSAHFFLINLRFMWQFIKAVKVVFFSQHLMMNIFSKQLRLLYTTKGNKRNMHTATLNILYNSKADRVSVLSRCTSCTMLSSQVFSRGFSLLEVQISQNYTRENEFSHARTNFKSNK